jgi:2'-5' RNA ligase
MRGFVAVELSPELRRPLVGVLRKLPRTREVRWCTENQLHVTLKFLGEVSTAQIPRVCAAIQAAAAEVAPFAIKLGGLGCFPSARSPRVLWCGITDAQGGCARWVAAADPLLAELGFAPEQRAFTPHITLGRSKSRAGGEVMQEVLEDAGPFPDVVMQVDKVVLFESRLLPGGAQYTPVATAQLGAGA